MAGSLGEAGSMYLYSSSVKKNESDLYILMRRAILDIYINQK